MLLISFIFSIYQVKGQSSFSGTNATQNNTLSAGTTGDVNLGGSAGINNTSSNGIFIGYQSGFNNTGNNNTFAGHQTGYSTTGSYDTFIGYLTGFSNTAGYANTATGNEALYSNTTGYLNCAYGYNALHSNTTEGYNNAFGANSLYSNTTGGENCAFGTDALRGNTTGWLNCAFGISSLISNTTGNENSAFGLGSLLFNSTGMQNTAVGSNSMQINYTGSGNSALGYYSLPGNTTGGNNTAIGYLSLYDNTYEEYNTALGAYADVTSTHSASTAIGVNTMVDGQFSSAIGYNAVASGDNIVQLGDVNCTGVWTQVYYYTGSDKRFKFNIANNVSGLKFINKLRPVTFQFNTEALDDFKIKDLPDSIKIRHKQGVDYNPSKSKIHSGFIAQEVEQAAIDAGFNSSIVSVPSDTGKNIYGIAYSEIVVPLVKAVQELSKSKDSLTMVIKNYENRLSNLENVVNACCTINKSMINNGSGQGDVEKVINIELANDVILYQNEPNPFGENTVIRYYIPSGLDGAAYMVFTDLYGKELNKIELTEKGFGKINADTQKLGGGVYTYSLIINGVVKDTRKMIKE